MLRIIRIGLDRIRITVDNIVVWEGTQGEWSFALANAAIKELRT